MYPNKSIVLFEKEIVMKSLIYYPGFEMKDEQQLKFALLYMDELQPIIPPYMPVPERVYLSETAIRVLHNTDLISPYYPDFADADYASLIACNEFDKIISHPERYSYPFTKSYNVNILKKWRNPQLQYCNLYQGKFSPVFFDYCLENGLANPFSGGISISEDLAFIYMSLLADIIAKKEEKEMFTDIQKYDSLLFNNDEDISNKNKTRLSVAKESIDCIIPERLNHISIDKIIALRNDRDFQNLRRGYVEQYERYLDLKDDNPNITLEEVIRIQSEIKKLIGSLFGITSSIVLSYKTLVDLQHGQFSIPEALATIYLDTEAVRKVTNAYRNGMPDYIHDLKTKIQAKRYVAKLKALYN